MFFVLNISGGRSWILSLDGYATEAKAKAAISWQVQGGEDRDAYRVCTYDGRRGAFVSRGPRVDGGPGEQVCTWTPDRGPYTGEAWAAFCVKLGGALLNRCALEAAGDFLESFDNDPAQDHGALALVRAALARLDGES